MIAIEHERNQLQVTCEAEEKEIAKLSFLTVTIDDIVIAHGENRLTLDNAYEGFDSIKVSIACEDNCQLLWFSC